MERKVIKAQFPEDWPLSGKDFIVRCIRSAAKAVTLAACQSRPFRPSLPCDAQMVEALGDEVSQPPDASLWTWPGWNDMLEKELGEGDNDEWSG